MNKEKNEGAPLILKRNFVQIPPHLSTNEFLEELYPTYLGSSGKVFGKKYLWDLGL